MGRWLRGPLKELMRDTLGTGTDPGIFSAAQIERLQREHLSGARKHSKLLFSLLIFHLWYETHRKTVRTSAGQTRPTATFAA